MPTDFRNQLRIAIVQTTLNSGLAWTAGPPISQSEEARACAEIQRAFVTLHKDNERPDFVLIPELACPRGFLIT